MAALVDPSIRAIDSCCGSYLWGRRDCLTLANHVYNLRTGRTLQAMEWHKISHNGAIRKAIKLYGTVANCYKEILAPDVELCAIYEGDLVILVSPQITMSGILFDPKDSGGALLALLTKQKEVWCYTPQGLGEIVKPEFYEAIFKFRLNR